MLPSKGMIGLLKALGATNWQIVKIFTYNGLRIISIGMILGNIFGLSLCAAQYFFNIM